MRDEKMKPGSPTYKVVSSAERWQVLYWTTAFACTEAELRAAISSVGDDRAMVGEHIANSKAAEYARLDFAAIMA
jgi:hypothetical protein